MNAPGSLAAQEAARVAREATVSPKGAEAVLSDLERRIEAIPPWTDADIAAAKVSVAEQQAKWQADTLAALGSAYHLLACLPQSYDRADVPKLVVMQTPARYVVNVSIWTRRREEWNHDSVVASDTRHGRREDAEAELETIRNGAPS